MKPYHSLVLLVLLTLAFALFVVPNTGRAQGPAVDPLATTATDSLPVQALRREARTGNAEAQYQLGHAYAMLWMISPQERRILRDIQRDWRNTYGHEFIGTRNETILTDPVQYNNARTATARLHSAEEYLYRRETAPALQLLEAAAKQNHTGALLQLAYLYRDGQGVKADHATEAEYYRKAAALGCIDGHSLYATACATGEGVKQSLSKAVDHFQTATDGGSVVAAYNWAVICLEGGLPRDSGYPKNPAQAYVLTRILVQVLDPTSSLAEKARNVLVKSKNALSGVQQLQAEEQVAPTLARLREGGAKLERLQMSPDLPKRTNLRLCNESVAFYQSEYPSKHPETGVADVPAMESMFGPAVGVNWENDKQILFFPCADGFLSAEFEATGFDQRFYARKVTAVRSQWVSRPGLREPPKEVVAPTPEIGQTPPPADLHGITSRVFDSRFSKNDWKGFVMKRYHLNDPTKMEGANVDDFFMYVGECNEVADPFGPSKTITWIYKCKDGEVRMKVDVDVMHKTGTITASIAD